MVNSICRICWLGAWECVGCLYPYFANNVWFLQWILDIVCVYVLPKLSETLLMKLKLFIKTNHCPKCCLSDFFLPFCKKLHPGRPLHKKTDQPLEKEKLKQILKFCKMSRYVQEVWRASVYMHQYFWETIKAVSWVFKAYWDRQLPLLSAHLVNCH